MTEDGRGPNSLLTRVAPQTGRGLQGLISLMYAAWLGNGLTQAAMVLPKLQWSYPSCNGPTPAAMV